MVRYDKPASAIFCKNEANKRLLFYTDGSLSNFSKDENAFLKAFDREAKSLNLPLWWQQGDTLRFAHVEHFSIEKTKAVNDSLTIANQQIPQLYPRRERKNQTFSGYPGFYRQWQFVRIWQMQGGMHQCVYGIRPEDQLV